MKWNDLTMKERSDLMSLFLKAGVGSLSDMRHIYDGTKDTIPMQTDDNGNLRDSITPTTVSASLSRDEWNNLYAQGKVSLSQIPRKHQSWIEGQNSKFKADITKAMHNAGENYLIPAFLTAATLNPIIGRASDIASIGSQIATGNFTGAAIDAATAFLPEVLEKPITQFLRKRRFLKNIPKVPDFEGSESSVYIEGDRVFKIPDQGMAPNTKEEAKRIAKTFMDKRNSIPNQASLKYEGLVSSQTPKFDKNGNPLYYPVFSQEKMLPFSNNISEIEQEYIMKRLDDRMNPYGWTRQGSEYVHPSGKHVSDLKPENLATGNDGNIYIIDGDVWGYKNGGFVENPLKYKYPDGGELKPATITEKLGRMWDNLYWHKFRREPKDFSDEVTEIPDCAKWSNRQLINMGYKIYGDAWTRSSQKVKKVYSGYDGLTKPSEYTYSGYRDYVLGAADNVKKNFNWRDLKEGDVVGMYFRGSPNYQKAFINGTNGEAQTHTGHIVYRKGKPYVAHNVHGDIKLNKAKRVMGRKHPYGIVSIYRPYVDGGLLL